MQVCTTVCGNTDVIASGKPLSPSDSKSAPATEFVSDQANRARPLAGDGGKLEVHHHYLAEMVEHLKPPAQPFYHRMVEISDQELLERDLDQIPESEPLQIPLGFAEGIRGLQGFVGAELLVGDDTKPMGLGPVGVFTQAAPPGHILAVRTGETQRQKEQVSLPRDAQAQLLRLQ
jgi:hypothetical protein